MKIEKLIEDIEVSLNDAEVRLGELRAKRPGNFSLKEDALETRINDLEGQIIDLRDKLEVFRQERKEKEKLNRKLTKLKETLVLLEKLMK